LRLGDTEDFTRFSGVIVHANARVFLSMSSRMKYIKGGSKQDIIFSVAVTL
jgi:hypothetical protein